MRVEIKYFGFLKTDFHKNSENVQLPEKTKLVDLLLLLAERYGQKFKEYVFDSSGSAIKKWVVVLVNGKPSGQLQGLVTELNSGDLVEVMPIVSGGG